MAERVRVALDAMGGDNAPGEQIKGAVEALKLTDNADIILVGQEEVIRKELAKYSYDTSRISIRNATEVIETGEPPVNAIRKKKDSSIVVAEKMIRAGEADGFVSSGSTGAVLVGGQLLVGRIKGVDRAALGILMPTLNGISLMIDCGANVDARPEHMIQFARMGAIYYREMIGKENPTVGLINIGAEEDKGNALTKETYQRLKACTDLNFIGNVEPRDVPAGASDIYVTEAFAGNSILKTYEGTAGAMLKLIKQAFMSSLKSKIGALLVKDSLKDTLKMMDATEYGGAPLLGLNGLVCKTHGNATYKEVSHAVVQCVNFTERHLTDKIRAAVSPEEQED